MKHNNEIPDGNQQVPSTVDTPDDKQTTTVDSSSTGDSRRRFIKGALAAAPVLMTVTSRPVWGNVCAPSGVASGNLSTPGGVTVECPQGLSPDYYATGSNAPNSVYFDDVFGVGPNDTLKQVVKHGDNFEKAAVAAYLNAEAGLTSSYLSDSPGYRDGKRRLCYSGTTDAKAGSYWDKETVQWYFTETWTGGPSPPCSLGCGATNRNLCQAIPVGASYHPQDCTGSSGMMNIFSTTVHPGIRT